MVTVWADASDNAAGAMMRPIKMTVRFSVIAPFLFYLMVFLLWFPRWQAAPNSASARVLGLLFGAMTAVLGAVCVVGGITGMGVFGWRAYHYRNQTYGWFIQTAMDAWDTFIRNDSNASSERVNSRKAANLALERPALFITKRLKDGTPIRGECPLCEVEFSTEAFVNDPTYPHESTLDQWYGEHYEGHLEEF